MNIIILLFKSSMMLIFSHFGTTDISASSYSTVGRLGGFGAVMFGNTAELGGQGFQ